MLIHPGNLESELKFVKVQLEHARRRVANYEAMIIRIEKEMKKGKLGKNKK